MEHISWGTLIEQESKKDYFIKLKEFIKQERSTKIVYPLPTDIFNAFKLTPLNEVKVVILGVEPHHTSQEHGLAYSTNGGTRTSALKSIFCEINEDYMNGQKGINIHKYNNLTTWAKQGVLLLNTILTVEKDKPFSHKGNGWDIFVTEAIKEINKIDKHIVIMLWGKVAQEFRPLFTNKKHLVLEAPHPAARSAHEEFLGCKHFTKCNEHLVYNNPLPINWSIL